MSFDEEPEDIHGECAREIATLRAERDALRSQLVGAATAQLEGVRQRDATRSRLDEAEKLLREVFVDTNAVRAFLAESGESGEPGEPAATTALRIERDKTEALIVGALGIVQGERDRLRTLAVDVAASGCPFGNDGGVCETRVGCLPHQARALLAYLGLHDLCPRPSDGSAFPKGAAAGSTPAGGTVRKEGAALEPRGVATGKATEGEAVHRFSHATAPESADAFTSAFGSVGHAEAPPPPSDYRALAAAPGTEVVRPEVAAFALLMEAKLREKDHRGGWDECTTAWLMSRLREEAKELAGELSRRTDFDGEEDRWARLIGREAADVANFAMMIADVCGALAAPRTPDAVGTGETCRTCGFVSAPGATHFCTGERPLHPLTCPVCDKPWHKSTGGKCYHCEKFAASPVAAPPREPEAGRWPPTGVYRHRDGGEYTFDGHGELDRMSATFFWRSVPSNWWSTASFEDGTLTFVRPAPPPESTSAPGERVERRLGHRRGCTKDDDHRGYCNGGDSTAPAPTPEPATPGSGCGKLFGIGGNWYDCTLRAGHASKQCNAPTGAEPAAPPHTQGPGEGRAEREVIIDRVVGMSKGYLVQRGELRALRERIGALIDSGNDREARARAEALREAAAKLEERARDYLNRHNAARAAGAATGTLIDLSARWAACGDCASVLIGLSSEPPVPGETSTNTETPKEGT